MRILSLTAIFLSVALTSVADYREGYYDAMDGKMKAELKMAAKSCVADHKVLEYKDLPNHWIHSDVYPDLYDGKKRWWDMYSDNVYLIEDGQTGKQSFSANRMQREHAVPKSWWKKGDDVEYTPAYSDMWNLYPSDGDANQEKSNYPFAPVNSISFDNGVSKVGAPVEGFGGGCKVVFEPADEYKGDFARAFFYMATVYDDLPWRTGYFPQTMFKTETWPTLTSWASGMLLEWSRLDPVSEKETMRNDAVETQQGNRNPYIDFPALAEYVWGERTGEVFYIGGQGGVDGIGGFGPVEVRIEGGCLHVTGGSGAGGFILTDIYGRILLRVDRAMQGDSYPVPYKGIVILTTGSRSRKIML